MLYLRAVISIVSISSLLASSYAFSSSKEEAPELTKNEQSSVDTNVRSFKINQLHKLYESNSKSGGVTFNRDYLIEQPMTRAELLDLNHPYLQSKLNELTEQDLENIKESKDEPNRAQQRELSIFNAAVKYAMESALFYEGRHWKRSLTQNPEWKGLLGESFPFHQFMLAGGKIRPPVITEIGFHRSKESERQLRDKHRQIRIKRQSSVITGSESYVDYFKNLDMPKPKIPSVYLLPVTDDEFSHWRRGVNAGWLEGHRQLNRILRRNTLVMTETLQGYLNFFFLNDINMISTPTFENIEVGTTSNGNITNVGESVFMITELPKLNGEEQHWLALPRIEDIFNEFEDNAARKKIPNLYNEGL
jgi:hypothetical protein